MAYNILKHRRGTTQEWLDVDLVPEDGELVIEELSNGNRKCKIGDGQTKFSLLPYIDDDLQAKLLNKINSLNTNLNAKLAGAKTEFSDLVEETARALENSSIERANTLSEEFISRDKKLALDLDRTLAAGLSKLQNSTQVNLKESEAKTNLAISEVKAELKADITKTAEKLASELNNVITGSQSATNSSIKELEQSLESMVYAEAEGLETSIASVIEDIGALDDSIKHEIKPAITDLDRKITKVTDDVTAKHDKDFELLHLELEGANSELTAKISNIESTITAELQPAINATNRKVTTISNEIKTQHNQDFVQLQSEINSTSNSLNTKINELKGSVEELRKPITGIIDKTVTEVTSELREQHVSDIKQLQEELTGINTVFETKLNDQASTFSSILSEAVDLLAINTETKTSQVAEAAQASLKSLEQRQNADLNQVKETFGSKIMDTETAFQEKLVLLKTELAAVDKSLADTLTELDTQSKQATADVTGQLDILIEKVSQLDNADTSLLNMLYETKSNITSLTTQFTEDIDVLKQRQNTDFVYINKELSTLAEVQDVSSTRVINMLFEYITRFYIELADLVDDDITILRKVFTFENDLDFAIRQVDTRLTADLAEARETLTNKIDEINESLTTGSNEVTKVLTQRLDTIETTLVENIENLRSDTNLKIADNLKAFNKLEVSVQENYAAAQELIAKAEESITQLAARLDQSSNQTNERLNSLNSRIDSTNDKLDVQAKRLSNIIALSHGSTTGDAELMDIRNGYNGLYHESAGDAVRAVGNDLEALKASLPDYIPSNAVDGLLYEDNQLYLTSGGTPVSDPVEITGGSGGGGSISTVKVTNNLPSNTFTISKGSAAELDFTYTSFENEAPTGEGTLSVNINDKKIEDLTGKVIHGVAKKLDVTKYLKNGSNTIKVQCTDPYGTSRYLIYTVSVIELKIESTFNSTRIFDGDITFRYKVFGQVEKTVHVLLDGKEISKKTLSASVSGNETTVNIPMQAHGCHKITAFISATINDDEVQSNVLEYEILCKEADNAEAMIASICSVQKITQGDLVTIPYILYDPAQIDSSVDLVVSSQVAGQLVEFSRTTLTVNRDQCFWKTRQYPVGQVVFTISYTYNLYGVIKTVEKPHPITIEPLEVDMSAEEDSLQLYLSAQGRYNDEQNPAIWTYNSAKESEPEITTTFTNFNWKSNGWVTDENGDTCLRLNGDAQAEIAFKPFATDFKENGKTIEFEFVVRDVNSREAIVIDCFDGERGFRATPDTAFLQSSGTRVSCRYKDNERIRVAVSVEYAESLSRFVSIYLDGVLSGVQRYVADNDNFAQENPLTISLGDNRCGLDVYSIRVYDKALTTQQILNNYIADLTEPTSKLELKAANDIMVDDKVSYESLKALGQVPIITFTGQMPTYKGDKKKKSVRMKFEDPLHPELNFDVLLDQIDVQGTSSQFYVRKNWKVKLPEARPHMPGAMPAKVFCIKVDYAEATGTHNTGTANYVETFYDREEVTLPPQKDDTRVRTTVQGFPCIIFEKANEDADPVFSSKGNFNYDKDAEGAFGFTETYDKFGVECWEVCNNTAPACNFLGEIPTDWSNDFEPRYVPESAQFERIEKLLEARDNAAKGLGIFTTVQANELARLQDECVANFKELHDWVLSTATFEPVLDDDGKVIGKKPITEKPLERPVTYGATTYETDNAEYRLAKFKYEFEDYFNMHYSSIYYVFTFFALMTDQRAKNMFLTRWQDGKNAQGEPVYHWYPYFYDNDTIFGINNEGALVFDYYHEDTDQLGSSNVYNGQNSTLWNNFRTCFPAEISETYAKLRSENKLTYDAIINQYVTNGSDKWSAAIYNEDAEYKYVSMAREIQTEGDFAGTVDDSNLYQVRGPGEHHLRYFVANRLNYCDSKWYAGKYPDDYIFLRIYTPTLAEITDDMSDEKRAELEASNERIRKSLAVVPANPNITVTPFSNMYAGVKYKANGLMQQERLSRGQSHTFEPPTPETFNDTETGIYGASELTSLGDLSGLYCGVISLGKASKLTDIVIGNPNPDYHNDNFREIRVGSNRLLRLIDLRNCSGLGLASGVSIDSGWDSTTTGAAQTTLDLSGCPNIETIYTEGTNLQAVALPESGYIKTLHLPASIRTLVIKNQLYISDFSIESYNNIRTLRLENCPTLDTTSILESCKDANGKYTVDRVHLTGINWSLDNTDFIKTLYPRFDEEGKLIGGIRGVGTNNENIDDAYLVGTCYIKELTGTEYAEIKAHYPYLNIKFGKMTSNVNFVYTDKLGEEHAYTVPVSCTDSILSDCLEPVLNPAPAWPENAAFTYQHVGWSRKKQVSKGVEDSEEDYLNYIHLDALQKIDGDRTLYPVYKAIRKSYPVHFVNPTDSSSNNVLQTVMTPYGYDAEYTENIPVKLDAASPDLYAFTAWYPLPDNITGETTCYAQFAILNNKWYTIAINDISEYQDSDGNILIGHTLNETNKTLSITKCNNKFNAAVKIPENFTFDSGIYQVTNIGGFSSHTNLELIHFPDTTTQITSNGFNGCSNLFELTLPAQLKTIGTKAFQGCTKLKAIYVPAGVTSIGDGAFADCKSLVEITVDENNARYIVIDNCLIDLTNKKLLQGLSSGSIPQDGSISSLGEHCFSNTALSAVWIPEGITIIPANAFSRCYELKEAKLPSTIKTLDATCFAWCYNLTDVNLPEGLRSIKTYVFNECALKHVTIPATVESLLERSFGSIATLETVTFEKHVDANGNIVVPKIDEKAFLNSGGTEHELVFNLPWSADQTPLAPWGAKNYKLNFDYVKEEE